MALHKTVRVTKGITSMMLINHRLSNGSALTPRLWINGTATEGVKAALGRSVQMMLQGHDFHWLLSKLISDHETAEMLRMLLDKRDELLEEAETAAPVRRVAIINHLSTLLLNEVAALEDSMAAHPAGNRQR